MGSAGRPLRPVSGRIRPVGEPERAALQVYVHERVVAEVDRVARTTQGREWGGVLFGWGRTHQGQRPVLWVERAIPAPAVGGAARFHPTPVQVRAAAAEVGRQEELSPVGWFQTHPGYGVFVSPADERAHQRCFAEGSILLLYDRVAGEQALYVGSSGGLVALDGYFFVGTGGAGPLSRARRPHRGSPSGWLWAAGLVLTAALLLVALLPWRHARLPSGIVHAPGSAAPGSLEPAPPADPGRYTAGDHLPLAPRR